jgi:carboxyl-terminal processing protease
MESLPETNIPAKLIRNYAIVIVLLVAMFGLGYATGEGRIKVASGKIEITKGNVPNTKADYSLLWDALNELNTKFVDRPLDQQKLMLGAVSGLVAAAGDPYTTFFTPDAAKKFQEQLQGSFDGIGAEVGTKNDQIVIVAPIEGTPASRAGLLAGDAILEIDGVSTAGMTTDDAVSKIRGKAGTSVTLTIVHKGKTTPQKISITRAKIEIKSVKLDSKQIGNKKIAVIKINQFGDDTKGLLDKAIDNVSTGGYQGLVLDLRNNPGGYLETAVSTISNWVDPGQVAVKEIGYGNSEKLYRTDGVPRLKGVKTIILANGGSASASEIVAGALQDYKAATLVGEKTFGKGSVQELDSLQGNSEIKVTVAKWYTPNGRGIHKLGLEPDVKVVMTADDVAANKDPQMDKALELLK